MMTILWQKRDLVQNQDIGVPENLPADLEGLSAESLADLSWCAVEAYAGMGFVPVEVFDMPALIAVKLELLKQEYARVFEGGYPFQIEGHDEVLQMRQADLINWLVFKDSCDDMIAAGGGNMPAPLRIRCTSNNTYTVTAAKGREIILGMRAYGARLLSILWDKKDAIKAATNVTELGAVSVTDGWA
jgi:hypothetical protein